MPILNAFIAAIALIVCTAIAVGILLAGIGFFIVASIAAAKPRRLRRRPA